MITAVLAVGNLTLGLMLGYVIADRDLLRRADYRLFDWIEASDDGPWWRKALAVPVLWIRNPVTIWWSVKWMFGWRPPARPQRGSVDISPEWATPTATERSTS